MTHPPTHPPIPTEMTNKCARLVSYIYFENHLYTPYQKKYNSLSKGLLDPKSTHQDTKLNAGHVLVHVTMLKIYFEVNGSPKVGGGFLLEGSVYKF